MKSNKLYSDLEMIIIGFAIIIFTLGYTSFSLLIALYCYLKFKTIKWPYIIVILFLSILIPGTIITFIKVLLSEYDSVYHSDMLLRIRFFWIRIIFASSIFIYVYSLNYKDILKFVYYMSIPCSLAGLFQVITSPGIRVVMLTSEASAAGMYYIFMLPLLLEYYRINRKSRFWIILFIVVGLFIKSKAQILALPFILGYFILKSRNKKLKRVVLLIIILGIISVPYLMKLDQLDNLNYFINVLRNEGVTGLTEKNQVWSTFTLRFSSFLTTIQLFYENLLGIGFGSFHPEYIHSMTTDTIQSHMTGIEIDKTLKNELYATPKSIFFEYLVSSGLCFLIPMFLVVNRFYTGSISIFLKASLYALIIVSLMVELSPFITFLVINIVLYYKSIQVKNERNNKVYLKP